MPGMLRRELFIMKTMNMMSLTQQQFWEEQLLLWLLAIISSSCANGKLTIMEAGGVEVLSDKLAAYAANQLVLILKFGLLLMYLFLS